MSTASRLEEEEGGDARGIDMFVGADRSRILKPRIVNYLAGMYVCVCVCIDKSGGKNDVGVVPRLPFGW